MGSVISLLPDYDKAYAALAQLFLRLLDEQTASSDILLAGTFAKTDYLLKEKNAPLSLRRDVNRMRIRLTRRTETQRPETFMGDFCSLCLFVSLVCSAEIPAELRDVIAGADFAGAPDGENDSKSCLSEYFRVRVVSWDDEHILATTEDDSVCDADGYVRVLYSGPNQCYGHDHSYLSGLLREGMMLNLIHPGRSEQRVIVPEFIIVEPDFLVDVSSVAGCFETYAADPVISLLRRMEPPVMTEAVLMGNMAGELLDSTLHSAADVSGQDVVQLREEYARAAKRFFRSNATGVMVVAPGADFHNRAWLQMLNIRKAVNETLPKQLSRYDKSRIIVEPTFFSEMLGLQGRMDMLQTDMRVLVEQKAGQGAFVAGDTSGLPHYKEQHYIQMLLYMAIIRYNYRRQYDGNNGELHAFLLYSKYQSSLVGLGFAPDLLFSALKMRNLYVAQEERLCRDGALRLLSLKPEDINPEGRGGRLWQQYQLPRLESMLMPLRNASALEQAYFVRLFRFIALEHRLAKVGSQAKEDSGFAGAWLSSLQEKQQCGNILLDLVPEVSEGNDRGQVDELSLLHNGECGNFRRGDIVVLYPYSVGTQPDLRRTMVHRATITDISQEKIRLRLRHMQTDAGLFDTADETRWCIEHDFMESSYSSLYKGLHSFMCAPKDRRDLILMQRTPEVSTGRSLKGEYGQFDELQLRVKHARELFLIIGPPGTGKTSFGMYNTLCEELREDGSKVLVVAYTNRAVDEICGKLYPEIDFIRIGGADSASELYASRCLSNIASAVSSAGELKDMIRKTRVVVGTVSSVTAHLSLLALWHFSLCIVDEAGQLLEHQLLPLLSQCSGDGRSWVEKFVMIGDHKQLPAVVQQRQSESRVEETILRDIGLTDCRVSLFERLLRRYRKDPSVCYMLTCQGRMHRDIAKIPSEFFYDGSLREVPLCHQVQPSPVPRVSFVDVPSSHVIVSDKENTAEARVIVDTLLQIWQTEQDRFDAADTVGVIVPYRNQISVIRRLLAERLAVGTDAGRDSADNSALSSHPLLQIPVDTVERYQGSQRRYIIYGLTVQRHYQLRFLAETTFRDGDALIDRKLNVAMTRAKEYLIIVGNGSLVRRLPVYANLLKAISVS